MPTVRRISADAAKDDYRIRTIILGVIESDAFRMQSVTSSATEAGAAGGR